MPKGKKKKLGKRTPPEPRKPIPPQLPKPTPPENSLFRRFIQLLKRFWKWIGALVIGGFITIFVQRCAEEIPPLPGAEKARIDSTLSKVCCDPDTSKRLKALNDISDDAISVEGQMHLIGGLVSLIRQHRPVIFGSCPDSLKPLGATDQKALDVITQLSRALRHPGSRFGVLRQAAPSDLADSLHFDSLDLSHAKLNDANLRGASFTNSCLYGTRFEGALLDGSNFTSARLDSANFRGDTMRNARLESIISRGAEFRAAKLMGATFNMAQLRAVNFAGANLTCAYLANAVTDSITVTGAIMHWTFFGGSSLARAQRWEETRSLKSAYLQDVTGLSAQQRAHAQSDSAYLTGIARSQWEGKRKDNCLRLLASTSDST